MKSSELHEWLLAAKDPQLELSRGALVYALLPAHCGRTVLATGHLCFQMQVAAKRHYERGHDHRVMIHRACEIIADGIPTDYPKLAGWEELVWDGFNGTETWRDAR